MRATRRASRILLRGVAQKLSNIGSVLNKLMQLNKLTDSAVARANEVRRHEPKGGGALKFACKNLASDLVRLQLCAILK